MNNKCHLVKIGETTDVVKPHMGEQRKKPDKRIKRTIKVYTHVNKGKVYPRLTNGEMIDQKVRDASTNN